MTRIAPSWELLLADLSLILFVATAAALAHAEEVSAQEKGGPSVSGSPVALLRGAGDGEDDVLLARWLADYRPDPREQLTLTLHYAPGTFEAVQMRADRLRNLSEDAGQRPRIILEPGDAPALHASFAFDHAPDMARNLQQ